MVLIARKNWVYFFRKLNFRKNHCFVFMRRMPFAKSSILLLSIQLEVVSTKGNEPQFQAMKMLHTVIAVELMCDFHYSCIAFSFSTWRNLQNASRSTLIENIRTDAWFSSSQWLLRTLISICEINTAWLFRCHLYNFQPTLCLLQLRDWLIYFILSSQNY